MSKLLTQAELEQIRKYTDSSNPKDMDIGLLLGHIEALTAESNKTQDYAAEYERKMYHYMGLAESEAKRADKAEAELKRRDDLAWPVATDETARGGWKLNWDFLEAIEKKARAADGDEGAPSLEQIEIALISALEVFPFYAAPPAASRVPDEWRPIDTAPKDGTVVLLAGKQGRMADGYFGQPKGWANPDSWIWPFIHANPTHWMPMPAAPTL